MVHNRLMESSRAGLSFPQVSTLETWTDTSGLWSFCDLKKFLWSFIHTPHVRSTKIRWLHQKGLCGVKSHIPCNGVPPTLVQRPRRIWYVSFSSPRYFTSLLWGLLRGGLCATGGCFRSFFEPEGAAPPEGVVFYFSRSVSTVDDIELFPNLFFPCRY